MEEIKKQWFYNAGSVPLEIPTIINGQKKFNGNKNAVYDHNRLQDKICVANFYSSTKDDVDEAIRVAKSEDKWHLMSDNQRIEIIRKLPAELDRNYNRIVGATVVNTGKLAYLVEGEIRKIKEFVEFYTESYLKLKEEAKGQVIMKPKGISLVISPWNYPVSLPGGGIIGSLITGNNVIFKPSNLSILGSYVFAECFWNIGVPGCALQFLPINDHEVSTYLTKHSEIDYILFVGSTQVAMNIIQNRPNVYIAAEAGGKNVMMVTETADKDQLIKDIIQSCFMNAGQVCSSTSLITMVPELYDDKAFLQKIADSVRQVKVAHAWDADSKMCALVRPPVGDTLWGLTELEDGEEWLLEPKQLDDTGMLWSPGIRIGTKFGGKAHLTEFFAPTIAIMRVNNVEEGVRIANATGYGLTSAIQSKNKIEQDTWINGVKAGTISVNKDTTVCSRVKAQPFGGMGKSAFGSGIKVGGYNYVTQFLKYKDSNVKDCNISDIKDANAIITKMADSVKDPQESEKFILFAKNYARWYADYFSKEIDHGIIPNMVNIIKFVKTENLAIRINKNDSPADALSRIYAGFLCAKNLYVSADKSFSDKLYDSAIVYEDVKDFITKIRQYNRIRYSDSSTVESGVFEEAAKYGIYIATAPVLGFGRLELLHYLQEQTIVISQ